jgi:hypothetical protein
LAKLQGLISFQQVKDTKVRTMKLFSFGTHKHYHLFVYPEETIRDVKVLLDGQYGLSAQEILSGEPSGEVFDDNQLIGELDLSHLYHIRDKEPTL